MVIMQLHALGTFSTGGIQNPKRLFLHITLRQKSTIFSLYHTFCHFHHSLIFSFTSLLLSLTLLLCFECFQKFEIFFSLWCVFMICIYCYRYFFYSQSNLCHHCKYGLLKNKICIWIFPFYSTKLNFIHYFLIIVRWNSVFHQHFHLKKIIIIFLFCDLAIN